MLFAKYVCSHKIVIIRFDTCDNFVLFILKKIKYCKTERLNVVELSCIIRRLARCIVLNRVITEIIVTIYAFQQLCFNTLQDFLFKFNFCVIKLDESILEIIIFVRFTKLTCPCGRPFRNISVKDIT